MNSRDRLDDLLSEGRLSAPANERMFERIYGAATGRRRRWAVALAVPGLGALALLLLPMGNSGDRVGELRAKGGAAVLIEVDCARGSVSACPVGSPLLFRVDRVTAPVFLQAYADAADGTRTWLFPTRATPAPGVAPGEGPRILPQGAMLSGQPGRYRVHVVVSKSPLDREAVVQGVASSIVDQHVTDISMVRP
jgi:hypothetical protein